MADTRQRRQSGPFPPLFGDGRLADAGAGWRHRGAPPVRKRLVRRGFRAAGSLAARRAALRGSGPYPVLVLSGEQGSAKSTAVKILRSLVNPSHNSNARLSEYRRGPLFGRAPQPSVGLRQSFLFNPLGLPVGRPSCWRPVAVSARASCTPTKTSSCCTPAVQSSNGIENVAVRPDLADRAVCLTLEPVAEEDRRLEAELWARFEAQRLRILGALLDTLVMGLSRQSKIQLPTIPRMADFAQWAVACETVFWPEGTFLAAYTKNRQEAMEEVVASDPVANSIRYLKWMPLPNHGKAPPPSC